jgi:hypothetical protein
MDYSAPVWAKATRGSNKGHGHGHCALPCGRALAAAAIYFVYYIGVGILYCSADYKNSTWAGHNNSTMAPSAHVCVHVHVCVCALV